MDLGPYLKYYNMSPLDLARMIKKFVLKETGLVVTIGIGENMFQAKVALDILSKHNSEEIGSEYIEDELPIPNLSEIKSE